ACYLKAFPTAKPSQWQDCWRFPSYPLSQTQDAPGTAKPDFLFLPMTDWHTRIQRSQHLARELARLGHRCFYLNPNLGREFAHPVGNRAQGRVAMIERNVWEVHAGLPREPVFHHRLLSVEENEALISALREMVGSFAIRELVIVASFPLWMHAALALREDCGAQLIYDCHDLCSGFSRIAPEIAAFE